MRLRRSRQPKTEAAKGASLTDAEIAKIKTLPADEQDAALKQAVCPVSGDHLGNMGTPFKISGRGPHLLPLLRRLRRQGQGRSQGHHRQARQEIRD